MNTNEAGTKAAATATAKRNLKAQLAAAGIAVRTLTADSRGIRVIVANPVDRDRAAQVAGGTPSEYMRNAFTVAR